MVPVGIALLLLATALPLLIFALRGQRVDDHPLCRRCKFDLTGKPPGSNTCPECGADVTGPRDTVVGHRKSRRRLAIISASVLGLAAVVLAVVTAAFLAGPASLPYKPLFWLAADLCTGSPAAQAGAAGEILTRYNGKHLGDARVAPIVDALLKYQADPNRPWSPEWGNFIERAHAAGAVSDVQWQGYLDHVLTISAVTARPLVRRGDPVPVRFTTLARCGAKPPFGVMVAAALGDRLDDIKHADSIGPTQLDPARTWTLATTPAPDLLAHLPATGPATVPVAIDAHLVHAMYYPQREAPLAAARFRGPVPLTLTDEPTVLPTTDAALRGAVAAAAKIHLYSYNTVPTKLGVGVTFERPPTDVSYDVIIRADGHDLAPLDLAVRQGKFNGISTLFELPKPLTVAQLKTIDIYLRPTPTPAAATFDMTRYWNHPIAFLNVPVPAQGTSTAATTRPATFPTTIPATQP